MAIKCTLQIAKDRSFIRPSAISIQDERERFLNYHMEENLAPQFVNFLALIINMLCHDEL